MHHNTDRDDIKPVAKLHWNIARINSAEYKTDTTDKSPLQSETTVGAICVYGFGFVVKQPLAPLLIECKLMMTVSVTIKCFEQREKQMWAEILYIFLVWIKRTCWYLRILWFSSIVHQWLKYLNSQTESFASC